MGCGDWDGLDGNFQAQTKTNSNKIIQPSWSISISQFQQSFDILTIFTANVPSILSIFFDRNRHFLDPLPHEKKHDIEPHAFVPPTGYRSLYKAAAAVPIDTVVPLFGVWRLGRIGREFSSTNNNRNKIIQLHRPLFGYRKTDLDISRYEFQIVCHVASQPLDAFARPKLPCQQILRCQCLGCLDGKFQAQTITNRNKIIQPSF